MSNLLNSKISDFVLISLLFFSISINGFALEVQHQEKDGLFFLGDRVGVFVTSKYIGWIKDWKWDAPITHKVSDNELSSRYELEFKKQSVKSIVKIQSTKNKIKYSYHHQFNRSITKTIGGGIEFNLDLIPKKRKSGAKNPILLPNNSGWVWEYESGKKMQVKFSPAVSRVYFEKGNKSRIRALFFSDSIKPGIKKATMEVVVPEGSRISAFNSESGQKNKLSWQHNTLDPVSSFIDLSMLNTKPAGAKGFIAAVNDHFEYADGSIARFYGTNIQANSLFIKNKQSIQQHAKRLARLGFNLVRLHHHDSSWVKNNLIAAGNATQKINQEALDSYFWWVKCLKDEGIYVWVDLQVQRPWREGDNIPGWETDLAPKAKKGMNVAKGFIYLNKRMQNLTKEFNKQFLTTVNPYTKLALKDDPAVMGMMITNENDLTYHFGNAFLKNKNHPFHQQLFDEEVDKFAEKFNFSAGKLRETWKPGYSKYLLNDLEARFNLDMIHYLRDLGVKVPISTTSIWGRNAALFSLPALTTGDMIDAHSYAGGGPFKKSPLQKKPRYRPNFLHALGQAQVANKPFTVTEYNVGQRDDLESAYIPAVSAAATAAFQGWDAIMLYGYSQDGFQGGRASPWSSYTHPAIMGVVPAMALLYRQGHVAPAKRTIVLAPVNDELFTKNLSPKTSVTIRTSLEQHKVVVAMPKTSYLPWLKASKIDPQAKVVLNLNTNLLSANQDYIESDTGEIKRNWQQGVLTVNTARSQLAMGRIGGKEFELNDVVIKSKTPNAAIIFTSLDDKPIKASERILVSAVARVAKVKGKWKSSYISEPVVANLGLQSNHSGLRLISLRSNGDESLSQPLTKYDDIYTFNISEKDKTHWYIITK